MSLVQDKESRQAMSSMSGWSIVRTLPRPPPKKNHKKRKDGRNDRWTDGWMEMNIYIIGLARWLSMQDSGGVRL